MPRPYLVAAAAVLAAVLATAGCGQPTVRAADHPAAGPSAAAGPGGVADPSAAAPATGQAGGSGGQVPASLAFTGTTLAGAPFDAAALAGRPVALWFWAPWCPRCRAAAPAVARVADRMEGKATVLGVAGLSDDVGSMRSFVSTTGTQGLTHLSDGAGQVWRKFGVTSQETFVLLGADGSVAYRGALDEDALGRRLAALAA